MKGARVAYPLIVVLQHDFAITSAARVTAPLYIGKTPGNSAPRRLFPTVEIGDILYVVDVTEIRSVFAASLTERIGDIRRYRDAITASLDYLFHGI